MSTSPDQASTLPSAADLLRVLASRGVTIAVRNNRVWVLPASAYKDLTDTERAVIRHRRDEIKQLVLNGDAPVPITPIKDGRDAPVKKWQKAALVCRFCAGPCIGKDHPSYSTLHYRDPDSATCCTMGDPSRCTDQRRSGRRAQPSATSSRVRHAHP